MSDAQAIPANLALRLDVPCCRNCDAFVRSPTPDKGGACMRHPPQLVATQFVVQPHPNGGHVQIMQATQIVPMNPMTGGEAWCAEFRRKGANGAAERVADNFQIPTVGLAEPVRQPAPPAGEHT